MKPRWNIIVIQLMCENTVKCLYRGFLRLILFQTGLVISYSLDSGECSSWENVIFIWSIPEGWLEILYLFVGEHDGKFVVFVLEAPVHYSLTAYRTRVTL